jgi:hypothetical protein
MIGILTLLLHRTEHTIGACEEHNASYVHPLVLFCSQKCIQDTISGSPDRLGSLDICMHLFESLPTGSASIEPLEPREFFRRTKY